MAVDRKLIEKKDGVQQVVIKTSQEFADEGQWWLSDPDKVHQRLIRRVSQIEKDQRYRQTRILRHFRLYDGRNPFGFDFNRFTPEHPISPVAAAGDRITMNVIQAVVDTVTSKIAKNKPHPFFLTEEGRFDQRLRAGRMTRFIRGVFYLNDAYSQGTKVFRTAGAIGTGTWKIYEEDGKPKIEYVFPGEVLVDDEEAFYGNPRNRYQIKNIAKDVLKANFPDDIAKIDLAQTARATSEQTHGEKERGEYIRVIEAWHLPSKIGAGDGRRVIAIDGLDLVDAAWNRDYFPFEDFHWSEPLIGFWGRGLAEELEGIQVEINRLLIKIQLSHRMFAFPFMLVPKASNVSEKKFNNSVGQIYEYTGTQPPTIATHQTVHQEIYQHLDRLYRRAFEIAGVSLLSATSQKPAGLESGIAIREFNDIETERFMTVGQAYEEFYMHTARHIIDVMNEIEAGMEAGTIPKATLTVKDPIHRALAMIDWKDAKMDEADYSMQVLPVSSLRSSPAGRLADVVDRMNLGLFSKPVALQLLDMPDLSAEDNVELAQLKDIDWSIAEILEGREVQPPDAFQNLQLGIERFRAAYLNAKRDDAPGPVMERLREWITVASSELAAAAQPPAPQPGAEASAGGVEGAQSPATTPAEAGLEEAAAVPVN